MPSCDCIPGWYDDGASNPICQPCVYPCDSCTSATFCLTCITIVSNRMADPVCHCASGFYNDISDNCPPCPGACKY